MDLYRCLLLDAAAAVFRRAQFHAIDDDEAGERAAKHMRTHPVARGYSLWQSGRLVVEQHADAADVIGMPPSEARPHRS